MINTKLGYPYCLNFFLIPLGIWNTYLHFLFGFGSIFQFGFWKTKNHDYFHLAYRSRVFVQSCICHGASESAEAKSVFGLSARVSYYSTLSLRDLRLRFMRRADVGLPASAENRKNCVLCP